jgi:hypothetical protein
MTNEHCHPRPDPQEAPPTVPVRNRDLVRYRALLLGYSAGRAHDPKGTLSFEAWSAGVDLVLEYLRAWDRRAL